MVALINDLLTYLLIQLMVVMVLLYFVDKVRRVQNEKTRT